MKIKYIIILLSSLILGNCKKENVQIYPLELERYVNEFFLQANLRDQNLKSEDFNFKIEFGKIEENNVVGTCNSRTHEIIIDTIYWNRNNEQKREWLIFHELGHCLLERNHENTKTVVGECLSFMKGAENDFDCSINYYSEYWRSYYLDELFEIREELPNWYLENQEYENSFTNNEYAILIKDSLIERIEIDSFEFNLIDQFLIEIKFENWNTEENLVQIMFGDLTFKNCNKCTVSKVELSSNNRNKIFYSNDHIHFDSDIKLSIIRNQDIISFFVNELFVHSMEYQLITGNLIETNRFENSLKVDVKILLD